MLPWVWPFAGGPTASVVPWLVSCGCALLLLLMHLVRPVLGPRTAEPAWLIAAVLSSLIALLQYFGASGHLKPWINVAPLGEAFGNLRQRNQFATLTNIGLAVLLFTGWRRSGAPIPSRMPGTHSVEPAVAAVGSICAGALLALANAATLSRTGLLQLLALPLLAWVWRRNLPARRWRLLGIAALTYVAASLLLPLLIGRDPLDNGIGSRFRSPGQPCEGRWLLWENVAYLVTRKPWWGWGWGELDYAHFVTLYPDGRFCDILDNAHNLPLHLAVVWGVPVALLICVAIAGLVLRARPWQETVPARQVAWAVLVLVGIHSMFEYPLWYGPFQIAALLALGTLWRTARERPQDDWAAPWGGTSASARHALVPLVGAAATLLLVALAYAAWDYHRVSQIYLAPERRAAPYREDTLAKVQGSWLFREQVQFAELTLTPVGPDNAQRLHAMALALLHFSPEARVVEKLIDSALELGRRDEAAFYMLRYRIAFPTEFARWHAGHVQSERLPALPALHR